MDLSWHTKQKLADAAQQTCPHSDERKLVCEHGSVIYAVADAKYVHHKWAMPPPPRFILFQRT